MPREDVDMIKKKERKYKIFEEKKLVKRMIAEIEDNFNKILIS